MKRRHQEGNGNEGLYLFFSTGESGGCGNNGAPFLYENNRFSMRIPAMICP
jgi:hypothetical protein